MGDEGTGNGGEVPGLCLFSAPGHCRERKNRCNSSKTSFWQLENFQVNTEPNTDAKTDRKCGW